MGKESRLRSGYKPGETRQQYSNGDRKLYDRDAPIAGTDENVWHLMLLFEQKLEEDYATSLKRPIAYTELYHRISKDPDLTKLLECDTLYTSGKGVRGIPVVTTGTITSRKDIVGKVDVVKLVEDMMYYYFFNYSGNTLPSIDDFCNYYTFSRLKEDILEDYYLKYLKTSGTKVPVVTTGTPHPDKREPGVREVLDITVNRVYTESDIAEHLAAWREAH